MKTSKLITVLLFSLGVITLHATAIDSIPGNNLLKVDKAPSFPGGEIALKEYLDFNLGYISDPPKGVEKQVIARFVVSKDGLLQNVEIIQGINEELNRKALTLISNMPRWIPAQHKQQVVEVRTDLPIRFIVPEVKPPAPKPVVKSLPEPLVSPTNSIEPLHDTSTIYKVVENMPAFTGGHAVLLRYLADNLQYPTIARENGVEGMVVVQFIVEKDGSLSGLRVVKGIGAGCDEEAIRVMLTMPKWQPGLQRKQPVRVQFNLPIRFEAFAELDLRKNAPVAKWLDKVAQFPKGKEAMLEYIAKDMGFVNFAREHNIQGEMVAKFTVEKDGSIVSPIVTSGLGHDLDEKLIELLRKMPKWEPSILNGKPVKTLVSNLVIKLRFN